MKVDYDFYLDGERLRWFKDRQDENRFWWFREANYLPRCYAELNLHQFETLIHWFDKTNQKKLIGECNIPAIEMLLGFIYGNNISRMVQFGHFAGWSTLLLGWAFQRMNKRRALFTLDINSGNSEFTQTYVEKAGLDDMVMVETMNSIDEVAPKAVHLYFQNQPEVIFIDSSHNEEETYQELLLWWDHLTPGGVVFLHDASVFAKRYDKRGGGGVHEAIWYFLETSLGEGVLINGDVTKDTPRPLVYDDGCGLGIIQKDYDGS